MVDIQSVAAEIRRGKKDRKKKKKKELNTGRLALRAMLPVKKPQSKNIMACPIT